MHSLLVDPGERMDNDWESRWGCINSIWVTTEGVFCFGWLLHASRVGAGLMDGSRPEISWRASEQDTGGGLWGPRRSVGLGLLSFFKPLSTCRLSSLSSILSLPPLFSPPHSAYFFVPRPSGVLYWLLPFHSHCSMLPPKHQFGMCLMLL